MNEFERVVLEKHQLLQELEQTQMLLITLASINKDNPIRLTKKEIQHAVESVSVEIKALKSGGINLIVRSKDDT